MKQIIEISDDLALLVQNYLKKNPDRTLSDLVQETLVQKFATEQLQENSLTKGVMYPESAQIEKFMELSGMVKQAPRHSDEHAEDYVD
jgi:hypothetical protein